MTVDLAKVRTDFLNFPTAWAIQDKGGLQHHPRCSSVPGWDPISGPGLLCDCGAITKEWERLVAEQTAAASPAPQDREGTPNRL